MSVGFRSRYPVILAGALEKSTRPRGEVMRRFAHFTLCWALLAVFASSSVAQTDDGYIGIYNDSLGTVPCASVPPMTGTTLYVIAKTSGMTANGITGVEFRIEVTDPSGWSFTYTAPSGATGPGNPLDTSSSPDDESGVNLAFSSCVLPQNGKIPLGTINVFNA